MHNTSQYRNTSAACCTAVFATLREKIASEVSGSAMLADLLEKLNGMQEACARPHDFKIRFDVFVARAADYSGIVQPFLPELVRLLPKDSQQQASSESSPIEAHEEPELTWNVA